MENDPHEDLGASWGWERWWVPDDVSHFPADGGEVRFPQHKAENLTGSQFAARGEPLSGRADKRRGSRRFASRW